MTKLSRLADSPGVALASILVAMVSVQSGSALAKQLFPRLGALGTTSLRVGLAAALLCALWRPWREKLDRRAVLGLLLYGGSLGGMNLLFYLAIDRVPLGIAVALEFTGPLTVALLASRRAVDFVWAALALAGILLILPISPGAAPLDPLGIVLSVSAGVCWALYIVFGKRAGTARHAGTVTALGMAAAALVAVPIGVAHAGTALLDPAILPLALVVALLSSALPNSLEMIALKALPAKNFGILMSLGPAVGALAGLVFLHERLTMMQWTAIGSIIAASIGSSATAREPPLADAVP